MVLTKNEINRILETLPVGYYAKTKINVECVDGSQSYYDESAEKIVVGVDTINMGLKNVSDDFDETVAVRTVFYHEVSHLILTPLSLISHAKVYADLIATRVVAEPISRQEAFDLINIVEDERIESALRDYYLNTDFKWFVTQQDDGTPNTTTRQIFYSAVRFRKGKENILKAVSDLIIKYKKLSRTLAVAYSGDTTYNLNDYMYDIANLYNMCLVEKINQDKKDSDNQNTQPQNNNSENNQSQTVPNDDPASNSEEKNEESEDSLEGSDDGDEGEEEGNSSGNGECSRDPSAEEQLTSEEAEGLFTLTFDGLKNINMINEFRKIFKQFKTRGNIGGHTNAYSGVIDPRNIGRRDYKYFTRTNSENNGGCGKLHLNLWIDCSGSYHSNEFVTNQIIKALEIVERENRTFSFDVMDINEGVHVHDKNNRYIKTSGGNFLCPEMDSMFKAMQKPDARNYNIVLYDGEAYWSGQQKLFSAWNHDNVFIISDTDNERPIRANCKKAKTLFVSWSCGKTYAQMLEEKIYNILRAGFGA